MCSTNQVEVVFFQETMNNLLAEKETDPPFGLSPSLHILIWICPEQVAKQSRVWDVCWPNYLVDLV